MSQTDSESLPELYRDDSGPKMPVLTAEEMPVLEALQSTPGAVVALWQCWNESRTDSQSEYSGGTEEQDALERLVRLTAYDPSEPHRLILLKILRQGGFWLSDDDFPDRVTNSTLKATIDTSQTTFARVWTHLTQKDGIFIPDWAIQNVSSIRTTTASLRFTFMRNAWILDVSVDSPEKTLFTQEAFGPLEQHQALEPSPAWWPKETKDLVEQWRIAGSRLGHVSSLHPSANLCPALNEFTRICDDLREELQDNLPEAPETTTPV